MLNYEQIKQYLPEDISSNIIDNINKLNFFPTKKRYDITGKKFNRLIALGKGPNLKTGQKVCGQWYCLCDCGNIILVRHSNLTSGNTKSCGCLNNEQRKKSLQKAIEKTKSDLTNQKFGKLLALYPTEERKHGSVVWECICDCGNKHFVAATDLKSGRIQSCGCGAHLSAGVERIKAILNENNIVYTVEKTFESCRFPNTGAFGRFDFYIDNRFLLEFDGIQHFEEKEYFKDSLIERQYRDNYKNQWCKENNIPLKRIPYTEIDNINLEMIMGNCCFI